MNTYNFISLLLDGGEIKLNINHISSYYLKKHNILEIQLLNGNTITFSAGEESLEALRQVRLRLMNGK